MTGGGAIVDESGGASISQSNLPLIVEPGELERVLGRHDVLVVDLGNQPTHARSHVPGAVHLEYGRIVTARPPAMGLVPDDQQLGEALSSVGMRPDTHVVAYDDEGNGKACRLLWTLDVVGHRNFSLLNGGLNAWLNGGHRTEDGLNRLDRTLASLESTTAGINTIIGKIEKGEGTLGLLINDPSLYHQLDSTLATLNRILLDFQQNPKRYLKDLKIVDVF